MPRFLAVFVGPPMWVRPVSVEFDAPDLRAARALIQERSAAWLDDRQNALGLPKLRPSALADLQDELDEQGWELADLARDDHDWSLYCRDGLADELRDLAAAVDGRPGLAEANDRMVSRVLDACTPTEPQRVERALRKRLERDGKLR